MTKRGLGLLGLGLTLLGGIVGLASSAVSDKKQEFMISDKVDKAVQKALAEKNE